MIWLVAELHGDAHALAKNDWTRSPGAGLAGAALAAERATVADAAERRDQAVVRTLLKSGADVNAAQIDGTTALHWAAYHDDAETAALLVEGGRQRQRRQSLRCAAARAGLHERQRGCREAAAGGRRRRERHRKGRRDRAHDGRAFGERRRGESAARARRETRRARAARADRADVGRRRRTRRQSSAR